MHRSFVGLRRRLAAGLLSLVLIVSLLPAPIAAADWMSPYLNKLVEWGIMRGDQPVYLQPDKDITRAEFVSLLNRAFGYDARGEIPFKDVSPSAWYYDDIRAGYHAGYFSGTSATTAAPDASLTREQATLLLGHNLMLTESTGEILEFTDGRTISSWSRGIVKRAVEAKTISGYPDGSFRPQRAISRGEAAALLCNSIGTPIRTPGDYTMGNVYGNVTISTSGVTLRNTVIAGDLYLTGGVGLGYLTLENVTVLGKIVASGTGEGNRGDSSIIMRNVTASEMLVDTLADQFVTIRAEGDTKIDQTNVRTPSYLEDATRAGKGFLQIALDGAPGTSLDVAGTVKQVDILTPNAKVKVAKGTTQVLTVDEKAVGTTVDIAAGAEVKVMNLDVATRVTGTGDIETLNIYAGGCSTTMLPDKIVIRPGLTGSIAGEVMDSKTAAESSEDPRLLSGFPQVTNLAPTSASAIFRTNKKGTIHWAVTAISDGSVSKDELLNPSTYATKVVRRGTIAAGASNTDYAASIAGLTSDGSYYLSAVLVDARKQSSPVKVVAFGTPDGTVPNFASGYPVMSKVTNVTAQVTVMPTKTCQLYYALLPKGSTAPTPADFKASAVTGNLGFGQMEVLKNTTFSFAVNSRDLDEVQTYDLYLWLTDLDGAKSSAVRKLSFTTTDGTPPVFLTEPTVNSIKPTSVGLVASLNEVGTIFWVVVPSGDEYPKPMAGQTQKPALTSPAAKMQVANGMNALKSGKATAAAAKDVTLNISGLTAQTSYDLYYVAQDKAGNYSETVKMIPIHTLDETPPTVKQSFTSVSDAAGKVPRADTDIVITFNEAVQDLSGALLVDLYNTAHDTTKPDSQRKAALQQLTELLRKDIQLWDATILPASRATERLDPADRDWVVDYSQVKVEMKNGNTVLTFKNGQALKLQSGSSYYFQIADIADTSNNKNIIRPNPMVLDTFKVAFAQVTLQRTNETTAGGASLDYSFRMYPTSTANVAETICWDLLLWSDALISFDLYQREWTTTGAGSWKKLNQHAPLDIRAVTSGVNAGVSVTDALDKDGTGTPLGTAAFEPLREIKSYEYGIRLVSLNGVTDSTAWNQEVKLQVSVAAGGRGDLFNLAADVSPQQWSTALADWDVTSIGVKDPFSLSKKFSDSKFPVPVGVYPTFTAGDSRVAMDLMLDRAGTVYYVIAPVKYDAGAGTIIYDLNTQKPLDPDHPDASRNVLPNEVPKKGDDTVKPPELALPLYTTVVKPNFTSNRIKTGSMGYDGSGIWHKEVGDLMPETLYYIYFVFKGQSTASPFSPVYCYQFTTAEVSRPVIELDINNPKVNVTVSSDTLLDYILVTTGKEDSRFLEKFTATRTVTSGGSTVEVPIYLKSLADKTTLDAAYGTDLTILDAMSTDVVVGNKSTGTVFDLYADQGVKDDFARLIRNQGLSPSVVTMKGQGTFYFNKPMTPVDCTKGMTGTTYYTFLSVGRSTLGSGDAFRASRPVFLTDNEPPVVNACTTINSNATPIKSLNEPIYGSVTVVFNEDLYFKEQTGVDQKVRPIEATARLNPTGTHMPIGSVRTDLTSNIILKTAADAENKNCSTLTYTLSGARQGSVITFDGGLCDKGGNNRANSPLVLTLRLKEVKQADGTIIYEPYFTITPDWDRTK